MLRSFFVEIWEHFKDGWVWGLFYRINSHANCQISISNHIFLHQPIQLYNLVAATASYNCQFDHRADTRIYRRVYSNFVWMFYSKLILIVKWNITKVFFLKMKHSQGIISHMFHFTRMCIPTRQCTPWLHNDACETAFRFSRQKSCICK